jgi:hypothetical protein
MVETDGKFDLASSAFSHHFLSLFNGHINRLFYKDMFPGSGRIYCDIPMSATGGADGYCIDIFSLQELPIVSIDILHPKFVGKHSSAGFAPGGNSHQLG